MENIEDRVKKIVSTTLKITGENLQPNSCLPDDLHADSLDIMEVVMELEKEFNIIIPDEDVDRVVQLDEAIKYIEGRLGNPSDK